MQWEPYDPTWLVVLAREQHPDLAWLPEALAACSGCCRESAAYIHFVDPGNPNRPHASGCNHMRARSGQLSPNAERRPRALVWMIRPSRGLP